MKFPALALSGNSRRNPLLAFGFLVFVAIVAYMAATYVIADDMTGLAYVTLAFVGCAFVVAMLGLLLSALIPGSLLTIHNWHEIIQHHNVDGY